MEKTIEAEWARCMTAFLDRRISLFLSGCLISFGLFVLPTSVNASTCGPHQLTYAVHGSDGTLAAGIRCVKVFQVSADRISASFDWYGEGAWGGNSYRHVGTGYTALGEFGSLARAADIFGNGEAFSNRADNILPQVTIGSWPSPDEIRITGDWNEIWRLAPEVKYVPLPTPTVCGPRFSSYGVSDLAGIREGSGLRCVADLGFAGFYLWFGTGEWGGGRYTHIGHFNVPSGAGPGTGQAVDLCDPQLSAACNDFPENSLIVTLVNDRYEITGAWSELWYPPIGQPAADSLSVLSLNVGGHDPGAESGNVPWDVRYGRVGTWAAQAGVVPDVISITEAWGWSWCAIPPSAIGDYDNLDVLMKGLLDATGVTYRVAYQTGLQGSYGPRLGPVPQLGRCQFYWSQALLYNPGRLTNLTAQDPQASVPHDADWIGAHLRRSLPLCNRGTSHMPLAELIDGPPQTDKCGRKTPSGPAWSLITRGINAPGPGFRILASHVRLAFAQALEHGIDVFTIHLPAGAETATAPAARAFVDAMMAKPRPAGVTLHLPPVVAGDFNVLTNEYASWLPNFEGAYSPQGDVIDILAAKPHTYPAANAVRVAQRLSMPLTPPGEECGSATLPEARISDHCGAFLLLEPVALPPPTRQPPLPLVSEERRVCLAACTPERDGCMQEVRNPGGPRPQQCVQQYNACVRDCPPR